MKDQAADPPAPSLDDSAESLGGLLPPAAPQAPLNEAERALLDQAQDQLRRYLTGAATPVLHWLPQDAQADYLKGWLEVVQPTPEQTRH